MPFKDIATTDSIFLEEVPPGDAKAARTTLRRMQEVRPRCNHVHPCLYMRLCVHSGAINLIALGRFGAQGFGRTKVAEATDNPRSCFVAVMVARVVFNFTVQLEISRVWAPFTVCR